MNSVPASADEPSARATRICLTTFGTPRNFGCTDSPSQGCSTLARPLDLTERLIIISNLNRYARDIHETLGNGLDQPVVCRPRSMPASPNRPARSRTGGAVGDNSG